jgi:hypothetical protein
MENRLVKTEAELIIESYETLVEAEVSKYYPLEFVKVVGEFQDYGDAGISKQDRSTLVKLSRSLVPKKLQKYSGTIYRLMTLPRSTIDLLKSGGTYNYDNISSWSKDPDIGKDTSLRGFLNDTSRDGTKLYPVLLRGKFGPYVLLDIDGLHKTKKFSDSIDQYFDDDEVTGLSFSDSQQEVMVGPIVLKKEHVIVDYQGYK